MASTLTFVIFFFSVLLLTVQLASGALSPRIITRPFQSSILKASLSLFVFTFAYGVSVLGRLEDRVPQMPVFATVLLTIISVGVFLFIVEFVGKELRPAAVMARVGSEGLRVIRSLYPKPCPATFPKAATEPSQNTVHRSLCHDGNPGVLVAVNTEQLVFIAIKHRCTIEVVPEVGDFVPAGALLFRVYDGDDRVPARELRNTIALGRERAMEQDPAFAIRIIVDIAAKALSPAINDPTTGVLAIDQLQCLLQELGQRDLSTGGYDANGQIRVVHRTPTWPDLVWLAISEIRQYGKGSVQIMRRLRGMLEHLIEVLPPSRAPVLQQQMELLRIGVARAFEDPRERCYAEAADTQGLGGAVSRIDSGTDC